MLGVLAAPLPSFSSPRLRRRVAPRAPGPAPPAHPRAQPLHARRAAPLAMQPRRSAAAAASASRTPSEQQPASRDAAAGLEADADDDPVPQLVVFDLDACLWSPEMFQLCVRCACCFALRCGVSCVRAWLCERTQGC
jgi:hypothetical protein